MTRSPWGNRLDSARNMGNGACQADSDRGDQAIGVFKVGLGADIREEVAKTALAQGVDVEFEGTAVPGDSDDLSTRMHRIDRLKEGFAPRHLLLGAAAGAFKDDIGTVALRQIRDGRDHSDLARIQGVVRAKLP